MKRLLGLLALIVALCFCDGAYGQACPADPTFNGKLACMLPDIYGRRPGGEGVLSGSGDFGNKGHIGHFDSGLTATLREFNGGISQQLSLLPLASPGSGFSLTFDPSLKTFVTSTDSLGPILSERADTVGRHRLSIGVSYQFFQFDKIDGIELSNFHTVSMHAAEPSILAPLGVKCDPSTDGTTNPSQSLATFAYVAANNPQQTPSGSLVGDCSFVRDRFESTNSIKLHVHQVTTYVTFGLTRNIDVSVVVPYLDVLFGATSSAQIVTGTYFADHVFQQNNDGTTPCPANFDLGTTPQTIPQTALFSQAQVNACFDHRFPDDILSKGGSGPASSSAKGIGDVTVRIKDKIWSGERLGIAAGVDIRFPTGDALNYLGSGAYGVKPFVIASYRSRIAPHAMLGFEANGSSVTSGDLISANSKGQIPNELVYDVGFDAYATKRLTGVFDIIGQRVFNTQILQQRNDSYLAPCASLDYTQTVQYNQPGIPGGSSNPQYNPNVNPSTSIPIGCDVFRDPQQNTTPTQYNYYVVNNGANVLVASPNSPYKPPTVKSQNVDAISGSTNITNASVGIKVALVKRLVLSLNYLVRLDNGGLHSKGVPMVALGYTF